MNTSPPGKRIFILSNNVRREDAAPSPERGRTPEALNMNNPVQAEAQHEDQTAFSTSPELRNSSMGGCLKSPLERICHCGLDSQSPPVKALIRGLRLRGSNDRINITIVIILCAV
jgi:hypothetical protein